MIFSKNKKHRNIKWFHKNDEIQIVKSFNYLGVLMNSYRNWNNHIEENVDLATRKLVQIRKIYYSCKEISTEIVNTILKAMVEPSLLYGSEIWGMEDAALKTDAVITRLAKEMLGVRKTVSSNGALGKLGWRKTFIKANERVLKYFLSTEKSAKKLQVCCIEYQKNKLETSWVKKIANIIKFYNMNSNNTDKIARKKEIWLKLAEEEKIEMMKDILGCSESNFVFSRQRTSFTFF